jgi:hypothetical protein
MTTPHLQNLSFEPEIRRLVTEAGEALAAWNAEVDADPLAFTQGATFVLYERMVDAAHSYVDQAILDASHAITDHRDEAPCVNHPGTDVGGRGVKGGPTE